MNYNFATHSEYLISIYIWVRPRLPSISAKGRKFFGYRAEFEQNKGVGAELFEQNKRFLRALPAGRISHLTSRFYPSLPRALLFLHLPPVPNQPITCGALLWECPIIHCDQDRLACREFRRRHFDVWLLRKVWKLMFFCFVLLSAR